MTHESYYTPPKQEIFEEVKAKAIELWQTYDDTYGYATSKVSRIKDIKNIKDNTCYMVAMFDINNQHALMGMVNQETSEWIEDLLKYARSNL